ncbi:MAG TPA: hypothetical protein VFH83_05615 [Spirochaetia bacterium]|nr:hypothetical protein [Spirochaetia bacterium]
MDESTTGPGQALRSDRLNLFETIIPGLAHEINNCNQAILLTAEVLHGVSRSLQRIADRYLEDHGDFVAGGVQYSSIREELQGHFEDIITAAQSIRRLVTDLRAFTGGGHRATDPVNLNRVLENARTLLTNTIRKSTDAFSLELGTEMPDISVDFAWLLQMVLLLILNACRGHADRRDPLGIVTRWSSESRKAVCEVTYHGAESTTESRDAAWATVSWMSEQIGADFLLARDAEGITRITLRIPSERSGG